VIGQVSAQTGVYPELGDSWAAQAWQAYTNAHGGINGHPVKVISLDTKQDPATAVSDVQTLINNDHIIAMVAEDDQNLPAWFPLLVAKGIPAIGGPCYFGDVICGGPKSSPNFFPVTTTTPAITSGNAYAVSLEGKKAFAAVVCEEVASCAQVGVIYKATVPSYGMKWLGVVKAAAAQPNYTAGCLELKSSGADSMQVAVSNAVALRFIQDCATQGYTPTYSYSSEIAPGVLTAASKSVGGAPIAWVSDGFPYWTNDPAVQQYRAAFAMVNKPPSEPHGTTDWAAFELFAKALANASANPTAAEVKQGLYALKNVDLGGLMPQKMTYTEGQPAPYVNCFYGWSYTNAGGYKQIGASQPSGNSVASGDLKSVCVPGTGFS
jgi:branched-chain amino acid transport system substrate-binding protein